jgi:hypothetical protein
MAGRASPRGVGLTTVLHLFADVNVTIYSPVVAGQSIANNPFSVESAVLTINQPWGGYCDRVGLTELQVPKILYVERRTMIM